MEAKKENSKRVPLFEWCAQSLEHASHCSKERCQFDCCIMMKRVVAHKEGCSLLTDRFIKELTLLTLHYNIQKGEWCKICKDLMVITCWHAKSCHDQGCRVPLCNSIKEKRGEPQFRKLEEKAMASMIVNEEKVDDTCIICQDNMKIARVEPCGHSEFCLQCILKWQKTPIQEKSCPLCRVPIKKIVPSKFSIPPPKNSACSNWHQRAHK